MRWFRNDERQDDTVALALAVGELKGQVAAILRELERLKTPTATAVEGAKALSPRVFATIKLMSQGHGELLRHLEEQARAMLADGIDEADIIAAIKRGS